MSLEFLQLRNFQCHKNLTIEFDPLVTTLVGRTDIGKSSILRALRWLAQNYPTGDEFVRDGAKFCKVRLTVDGQTITRRIGKQNEYRLDDKVYRAFGRDVPQAINQLLNLTDENFQSQLDAPFWFSLTPGQVSKELNRIINLGVIDRTLASLAATQRQAKTVVDVSRTRLKEAKQTKKDLGWVPAKARQLGELQAQANAIVVKQTRIASIAKIMAQLAQAQVTKDIACIAKLGANKAIALGDSWQATAKRYARLYELLLEIKRGKDRLCQLREKLDQSKHLLQKQKTCPICGSPLKT